LVLGRQKPGMNETKKLSVFCGRVQRSVLRVSGRLFQSFGAAMLKISYTRSLFVGVFNSRKTKTSLGTSVILITRLLRTPFTHIIHTFIQRIRCLLIPKDCKEHVQFTHFYNVSTMEKKERRNYRITVTRPQRFV
jgi:hypothetical protein